MNTEEFIVTLSSNDCVLNYPQNSPNSFKVLLGKPMDLEGDWEVAIMNIQYPFNWANYQEDYVAIFAKLKEGAEFLETAFHNSCAANKLKFLNDSKSALLYQQLEDYLEEIKEKQTDYKLIKIPTSYYVNPGAIIKYVTSSFNRRTVVATRGRKTWRIDSFYDAHTGTVTYSEQNIVWFQFASGTARFHQTLGLTPKGWNGKLILSSPNVLSGPIFKLNKLDRIFIHCDVIKYQIVGETQLPLLAILPIQGTPNEQCYWSFNPAYYLPLNQKSFGTLEIKLCTCLGDPFPFGRDGTVILQLHFRRKRAPW